jgi:hypothetical protein
MTPPTQLEPAGEQQRPEPVLDEAKVAGTVSAVVVAVVALVLLVIRGQAADLTALQLAVEAVLSTGAAAVALLAPVWRARRARRQVTPLEAPQTADGVPLVPIDEAQVVVAEKPAPWVVEPQTPDHPDHAAPE